MLAVPFQKRGLTQRREGAKTQRDGRTAGRELAVPTTDRSPVSAFAPLFLRVFALNPIAYPRLRQTWNEALLRAIQTRAAFVARAPANGSRAPAQPLPFCSGPATGRQ